MFTRVQIFTSFDQLKKFGTFKLVKYFDIWKEKGI